jgi:hypothetical protein
MEGLGIELSLGLVEKLKNEVPSMSRKTEGSEDLYTHTKNTPK